MDTGRNNSLEKVVRILECFTREDPELGVREVARRLNMPSSVAGRMMMNMKSLGMLTQNPTTKGYSLGSRVLAWAGVYLATSDIRNLAYPYLVDLHTQTKETISLYILEGDERVCIERLESTQNVRFVAPRVGRHLPLHAGSAGKVMLAYLPEEQREKILTSGPLASLTEKTIIDPEILRAELPKIKRQGYAISYGEWILDASGVAAPIFDRYGAIIGAVTISGPSQRFTQVAIQDYLGCLLPAATSISRSLGYQHSMPWLVGEAELVG